MTANYSQAYVTGYEYDVFVSYAHVDNERGWVTTFVKKLEVLLAEVLSRPRPRVWMDHQIRGNEPLDQIFATMQRTATLLVIRSPGYMKSEWCRRELLEFSLRHFGGGNRIFIAHLENPPKDNPLSSLRDLPGYTFWVEDPETKLSLRLGSPEAREHSTKYYKELKRLAQHLAEALQRCGAARASLLKQSEKERIFLAEVPDEVLEPIRSRVEEALRQAGLAVLPDDPTLQNDLQQFSAWARDVLPSSKAFVQILNEKTGKTRGRPEGLPALQYQLAREAQTPILQWRDVSLDPTAVVDAEHRQLLDGEYVRTCGIEELISEILTRARQNPQSAFSPEGVGPWVFINSDLCDRQFARQLREWFKERHFSPAIPIVKGSPREIRKYLKDNLQGSDAVVLVQGECAETWVSSQLMEIFQQERKRPVKLHALGLCQLPPPEKEEPDFQPSNLVTIDGKQGLTPAFWANLEAFANRLQG